MTIIKKKLGNVLSEIGQSKEKIQQYYYDSKCQKVSQNNWNNESDINECQMY